MCFLTECMRGRPIETRCGYRAEFVSYNPKLPAPLLVKVYNHVNADRYDLCAEDFDIASGDKTLNAEMFELLFDAETARVELDDGVMENYYANGSYFGTGKNHYMDLLFRDTMEDNPDLDEECMNSRRSLTFQEAYLANKPAEKKSEKV